MHKYTLICSDWQNIKVLFQKLKVRLVCTHKSCTLSEKLQRTHCTYVFQTVSPATIEQVKTNPSVCVRDVRIYLFTCLLTSFSCRAQLNSQLGSTLCPSVLEISALLLYRRIEGEERGAGSSQVHVSTWIYNFVLYICKPGFKVWI